MMLFLNGPYYRLQTVTVLFQSVPGGAATPRIEDLVDTYGDSYRIVHVHKLVSEDETESALGFCDDPRGEMEILIFKEHALKLFVQSVDGHKNVASMVFSRAVWTGEESYPPCEGAAPPN